MADFVLPPHLPVAEVEWQLVDYSSLFPNTFGGEPKTYDRGQRWLATYRFQSLRDTDRATLMALAAALRGKANRLWAWDPANFPRGSFPATEILGNGTFATGATGWSGDAAYTRTVHDRVMRVTRATIGSAANALTASVSGLTTGVPYALRVFAQPGRGTFSSLRAEFSTLYNDGANRAPGMLTVGYAPSVSTLTVALRDYATSGLAVGDFVDVPYVSLTRCALVDGAQTGGGLNLKSLPASANGLLLPGDRIGFNGETKLVTSALHSNSSGQGHVRFEPALRGTVASDTPVVVHQPMQRFVMAEAATWPTRPGRFSDFSLVLAEAR